MLSFIYYPKLVFFTAKPLADPSGIYTFYFTQKRGVFKNLFHVCLLIHSFLLLPQFRNRYPKVRRSNLKSVLGGARAEISGICMLPTIAANRFVNLGISYRLVTGDT